MIRGSYHNTTSRALADTRLFGSHVAEEFLYLNQGLAAHPANGIGMGTISPYSGKVPVLIVAGVIPKFETALCCSDEIDSKVV